MRLRFLRLIAAISFVFLASPVFPQAETDWIRLGSWNIEKLPRGSGQHPIALAEYLHMAGVDVLALQEINDTDAGSARRNSELDDLFEILNQRSAQTWEYVLFENKDPEDATQLVGVAWNTERVTLDGAPFKIAVADDPSDDFNAWDRHPHAVKFKTSAGKTDFVVIPVHMKSNVGSGTAEQREVEAGALVAKLSSVRSHFGDEDIVIIGDLNCLDAAEGALAVYADAGFKDLNSADAKTFQGTAAFDRVLVPMDQSEFRFTRQYILAPADNDAHDRSLSDHYLVMAAIKIVADDE